MIYESIYLFIYLFIYLHIILDSEYYDHKHHRWVATGWKAYVLTGKTYLVVMFLISFL